MDKGIKNRHLFALLFYVVLIAITYSPVLFTGHTLSPAAVQPHGLIDGRAGDALGETQSRTPINSFNVDLATPAYYEWPTNRTIGNLYRSGELPLWNPYQGAGTPLLADYSTRALFPYQILENISPAAWADLFLLGRLLIAGFFTYLFLSAMGLGLVPALFGGLLYMLSGVFSWFITLEQFVNVAMVLPVLLYSVELLIKRGRWSSTPAVALSFALVILAGQPEVALYVLFLAASYFLFQSILLYHRAPARLGGLLLKAIVAMVVGLMLSAPLTLPFLKFVDLSYNLHAPGVGIGTEHVANWRMILSALVPGATLIPADPSITPEALAHLKTSAGGLYYRVFATKGLWDWLGGSTGVLGPLLALTGLFIAIKRRSLRLSGAALFFTSFATVVLLKNFGIAPFVWLGHLPLFDQAWSPRWSGAAWVFALCASGAIGLELLTSSASEEEQKDLQPENRETEPTEGFRPHFIFAFLGLLSAIVFVALPSVLGLVSRREALFSPTVAPYVLSSIALSHFVALLLLLIALAIVVKGLKCPKVTAALLTAAAALELWWGVPRGYGPDGLYLQLIPVAIGCVGLVLILFLKTGRRVAAALFITLFFFSALWIDSISINGLGERQDDLSAPPYVEFIKEQPGYPRVLGSYGVLFPNYAGSVGLFDLHHINALMLPGLRDFRYRFLENPIEGQDTASPSLWFTGMPQRITVELDDPEIGPHYKIVDRPMELDFVANLPNYSLMGVRYLLLPTRHEITPRLKEEGLALVYDAEVKIYENRGALERAFVIHPFATTEAFEAARAGSRAGDTTEMTLGTEIVDSAHRARLTGSETALITGAKILEYRANRVVVETDSAMDGVLILSDAHAPGWSATVDSKTETILKVNGFIRGVFVESGPHTVVFTYSPPG
ncbi:MAG: YfhO family protein, partial [Proteobacteria bacterium]|nr:YfhO family protein [Pseudomonadota bacterium]